MNFSFYIARRYLFSKKSHNAINIISLMVACAVTVAVMASVCALSVFNGFESLVSNMFSTFDPELKITAAKGKVFDPNDDLFTEIKILPEVEIVLESLEDNALVEYERRQVPVVLKGVCDGFTKMSDFESILVDGEIKLQDGVNNYALLGAMLAMNLGINARFVYPMQLFVPRRNAPVNLANIASSYNREYVYIAGFFRVDQPIYDENYMLVPIALARELFDYETEVSALELKLREGSNVKQVRNKIRKIIGADYLVQDRYEQQEDSFKMMQIEKWVTFLVLCFILLIAVFNVIASLSMLIVEKKEDVRTMRNLGADSRLISKVFLFEGWMIVTLGVLSGIVLGVLLCLAQHHYGWLKLGAGDFVVNAYPVVVSLVDVLIIAFVTLGIGFVTVLYPVRYLSKKWLT